MTDASLQPHWMPDVQAFAVQQERDRHLDTIFTYGECSIFVLMWRVQDLEEGLVARCSTCWAPEARTADAFGQAKRANCPDCYGTTFEGGYRAIITRPALWDHDSTEQHEAPRGDTFQANARVQTADDFALNTDDYVFRRDGTRWQVRKTDWELLRTGFAFPGRPETSVGWNLTSVDLEDETSVAYKLPPDPEQVIDLLAHSVGDHFSGCAGYEDIRAPLNPGVIEHRHVHDAAPALDSAERSGVFGRHPIDAAPASGSGARHIVRVRASLDAAPVTGLGARNIVRVRSASASAPAVDAATRVKVPRGTVFDSALAQDSASRVVVRRRSVSDTAPAVGSVATIGPLGGSQVAGVNVIGDNWGARGMGFEVTAPVIVTGVRPQFYSGPDGTAGCRVGIATGVGVGTLCRFPNWLSDGSGHQCFADIPIGTTLANFLGTGFSLVPGVFYTVVVANLSNTNNVATRVVRGSNGTTETVTGVIKNPGYNSVFNGGDAPGSDAGTFTQTGDFPIVFGGGQRGFKLFGHP